MKPNSKPFCQRQRPMKTIIEPLILQEVQKLWDVKFIFVVWYSTWVGNMVTGRKKQRYIHLCMDFRNLNQESQKDNFPLLLLDEVLQIVNGSKLMSFLDGCSRYNQVIEDEEDRMRTTFTTKLEIFLDRKMHFGLISVDAMFQRPMYEAFKGMVN